MNAKKILCLVLALAMVLSMAACGKKVEDPFADLAGDYDELSSAVYDHVLTDFNDYYAKATAESDVAARYASMAISEAKMLGAAIFFPTTSNGGAYQKTRIAPYTNTPVLWGNDTYRFHDRIVANEPITAEHINAMKAEWVNMVGTGEYEAYVKQFLADNGYTTKDSLTVYFDADPESWDVLATSNAADSEILVNTYDGLVEYDMENQIQPALAESWEISEDGMTYTFKLRQGQVWVDNQGREVAPVVADDFVAGMQHMMDTMGGLEYLVCTGCANIVGADDYVNGVTSDFADVGVKALDDYTVQYTLTQPTFYFMTMLGYGVFAPLSRAYYESKGGKFGEDFDATAADYTYGKGPDSIAYNGPFLITNFTSNSTIAMKTNESYWNVDDNNIKTLTYLYTDGSDPQKPYTDFDEGIIDIMGMTEERIAMAREDGSFDTYAYVSDTDATSFCGFFNVRRSAFHNFNDENVGVSPKDEEERARTGVAMLNHNFRLALAMSIDRATYNAQSVGEDLKYNSLINSYTPGTFVNLPTETTVSINGTDKTYPAGTFYGQIMQDQLDADGIPLTVWNGTSSSGFDGWYNPENAQKFLALAIEELKEEGVKINEKNPIYLDIPTRTDSETTMKMKQAMKQSIEAATGGLMKVNLIEYATRDAYLDATYWYEIGSDANFDLNDGSGWGPDYGDPSTYLGTMLPDGAGYMTKSLGIF